MNERIKQVRKYTGKSQTEFGKMFGVCLSTIQKWEAGTSEPTNAMLSVMSQKTGVNEIWLRTGAGEMLQPKTRAAEMAELFAGLMREQPEAFRVRLITALLRFRPDGPEWKILEDIYNEIAGEKEKADMD